MDVIFLMAVAVLLFSIGAFYAIEDDLKKNKGKEKRLRD